MKFSSFSFLALAGMAMACPETEIEKRASGPPPWNYDQQGNDWPNTGYPSCRGRQQAPIELKASDGVSRVHQPRFTRYDEPVAGRFGNWGYSPNFTVNSMPNSGRLPGLSFDNEDTFLVQWHMHMPAEHVLDGHRAAAEMHLVHTFANGTARAVLGLLLDEGNENDNIDFFSALPRPFPSPSNPAPRQVQFNMGSLINAVNGFRDVWTYRGSLTTPPCTEGKRFFIANRVLRIGSRNMHDILSNSRFSARALQPRIDQGVNQ